MLLRELNAAELGNRDDAALLERVVAERARHLKHFVDATIPVNRNTLRVESEQLHCKLNTKNTKATSSWL